MIGTAAAMFVPTRVAKKDTSFHGSVTGEPERQRQHEEQNTADRGELSWPPIRMQEQDAEEVREGARYHEIGRPCMNGSHEPAERHARRDELHALVGFIGARPVIRARAEPRCRPARRTGTA